MTQITKRTATGTIALSKTASPPPAGNDLETAARALDAGYGSTSYAAFTPATISTLIGQYLFDWQTRWHWDSLNLKGYMMCKAQESTGSPPYKLFIYDAATNVFTKAYDLRAGLGGSNLTGHGYDSSAFDSSNAVFYFIQLNNEQVVRWTGSAWVTATANISGGTNSDITTGPAGLVSHPNLFGTGLPGLVNVWSNRMRVWNKASGDSGAWSPVLNLPYTNVRYSQGAYCSELNAVVMTGGDSGLACFICYGGTTPTGARLPNDLPLICSSQSTTGDSKTNRLVPTPTGSVAVLESASPGRVWRLNTSTFAWELQAYTHNMRLSSGTVTQAWPIMYVSSYGVYWALRSVNNNNSTPNSILWRPPSDL